MRKYGTLTFCAGLCMMGLVAVVCGCDRGPAMGTVRGTVTLDGQPLEQGSVQLTAIDGRAPTAGAQIVNGKFETRAAIAKYRVQIESNVLRGPGGNKPDPNKKIDKYAKGADLVPVSLVPDKYNKFSTLEVDVKPGVQDEKFDLQSK